MTWLRRFKENWLQSFFFYGNNPLSLIGGSITMASAITWWTFWIMDLVNNALNNPYLGLIFFFLLPILFVGGLIMIAVGVFFRREKLRRAGQIPSIYPKLDLNNPVFRHGFLIVLVATVVNLAIVGTATYQGVSYMDSAQFCGESCHVMHPQWVAYQHSPHAHVACVECHVGSGFDSYVHAKMQGTKQLFEVAFHDYPRPIKVPLNALRPARATCEECHNPRRFTGDKLIVLNSYEDDEKNTEVTTVLVLHLNLIHREHLSHFVYTATNDTGQKIIAVTAPNGKGGERQFVDTNWTGPVKGVTRVMDCMDCHNQATHIFKTPQKALDAAMSHGNVSPSLPFVHKEGLALIQTKYSSQEEAGKKITDALYQYYKTNYPAVWENQRATVEQAAKGLVAVYDQNVFPNMNVTWGTYPNNIGHMDYPGCFRCHDGSHTAKDGKSIPNDCTTCHNILAVQESNPKILQQLGITTDAVPSI
ncbi:MAG: cytochrome c3 family protein [Acidobacteriaceae bacterium]